MTTQTPRATPIPKWSNLYFTLEIGCLHYGNNKVQFQLKTRKISRRRSGKISLDLQKRAKTCTKIYNARAQPLFCSLNLWFGDVLVAVAYDLSCFTEDNKEMNKDL